MGHFPQKSPTIRDSFAENDLQLMASYASAIPCMIHSYVKRRTHLCDTPSHVWHGSFIFVTWLIHMRDMTHPYVWHDSFIYVTWLTHMCDMTHSYVRHDAFICVTWLILVRDKTHRYVWRDAFIGVTWLIHRNDMTRSYVWHDAFTIIYMCNLTHSYVWCDSFISMTWLIHMVTWLIHKCDVTHSQVWHDSFMTVTWLIHTCDVTHSCVAWLIGHGTSQKRRRPDLRRSYLAPSETAAAILHSHVTHMKWVTSHVWIVHVTQEWVMSHMDGSWHTHASRPSLTTSEA